MAAFTTFNQMITIFSKFKFFVKFKRNLFLKGKKGKKKLFSVLYLIFRSAEWRHSRARRAFSSRHRAMKGKKKKKSVHSVVNVIRKKKGGGSGGFFFLFFRSVSPKNEEKKKTMFNLIRPNLGLAVVVFSQPQFLVLHCPEQSRSGGGGSPR